MTMLTHDDVEMVTCDMCAFGLSIEDKDGEALARKRTRLMSNSPEILKRLDKGCSNDQVQDAREKHRHADTIGGRAKGCQVYPKEFCRAVCSGTAAQKKLRNLGMVPLDVMSFEEMQEVAKDWPSDDIHETGEYMEAYDDVLGIALDPALMRKARREEIVYFKDMEVYENVSMAECWEATG